MSASTAAIGAGETFGDAGADRCGAGAHAAGLLVRRVGGS
jgi:hypothetical protein